MSKSIIPPTGDFGSNWPGNPNLPQGVNGLISAAGWTEDNDGFVQQTFLGASIRNFNVVAGFGNTTSSLSVDLVEDEYNKSDGSGFGIGDDVYHNGIRDKFAPPYVGSPVFFKFGKNFATIEQAWRKYFDEIYDITTTVDPDLTFVSGVFEGFPNPYPDNIYIDLEKSDINNNQYVYIDKSSIGGKRDFAGDSPTAEGIPFSSTSRRGVDHFIFGGILQSFSQNGSVGGNPLYSVQVEDPREILSNVVLILNNYAGSVFNNKNYLNIFGFLEHDVTDSTKELIDSVKKDGYIANGIEKAESWISDQEKKVNVIEKIIDGSGLDIPYDAQVFKYRGTDMFYFDTEQLEEDDQNIEEISSWPQFFPMTGEGFSRRCNQGIPWYRVRQALQALFEVNGSLPKEYKDAGFGGVINFRGYNYILDLTGLPLEKIPEMFFLDFDQIDLFSLVQEVCDVISHDLYVHLLPVIDHPACRKIWEKNRELSSPSNEDEDADPSQIIVGIIRVEAIDRSDLPTPGVIKNYIDNLSARGIEVESKDLGYELANLPTDKMVAGGQTVDMYFFSNQKDRDNLQVRLKKNGQVNFTEKLYEDQWLLETSLKQQILPFYGFLGKDAVTIPRGFGSYQQILLDSTGLDAHGVGNYYVATEMELRAAMVSYEQWSRFLLQYNELYVEEIGDNKQFYKSLASTIPSGESSSLYNGDWISSREFGVSVPRCLFNSDKPHMGEDGYPASPCSPPVGYPLYYKRAEKIGIPEAGIVSFQSAINECVTNYEKFKERSESRGETVQSTTTNLDQAIKGFKTKFSKLLSSFDKESTLEVFRSVEKAITELHNMQGVNYEAIIRNTILENQNVIKSINALSRKHAKNARKVYDFVKAVAEKHLGKTFLVRIPKRCNPLFDKDIKYGNDPIRLLPGYNPYGFKPLPVTSESDPIKVEQKLDEVIKPYFDEVVDSLYGSPFDLTINNIDYPKAFGEEEEIKDKSYSYGALKNNYNPISDQWEFNYKPDPQGGFFSYEMYDKNIVLYQTDFQKLPAVQKNLLAPMDLSNFENNGRISAYVRFDNSEFLDFSQLTKENFIQQIINENGEFIPDVMEELENTNPDRLDIFDQINKRIEAGDEEANKKKAVAFVKCDIDENFYMPPKTKEAFLEIYGRKISFKPNFQSLSMVEKVDESGCVQFVPSKPYALPIFSLADSGGYDEYQAPHLDFVRDKDNKILTSKKDLDPDYVYAIITLPGRIIPTLDQRYMDGPYQAINGQSVKHILTQDVVSLEEKYGFNEPGVFSLDPDEEKTTKIDCDEFTFKQLSLAQSAQKQAMSNIGFASAEIQFGFQHPSPVYPNLVALPLMSTERCYGPWFSSFVFNNPLNDTQTRYSNIGGKVEFVKDEALAPWNFGGYKLMNDAGALQAQFSNSLMLFSERGGFVIADAPSNIRMGRALDSIGPLVTSVSVDISESVKTTVRMDLYTARFGKLQKQKNDAIAQITRERQKIRDERNYLMRRGFAKSMASNDILSSLRKDMKMFQDLAARSSAVYTSLESGQSSPNTIIVSAQGVTNNYSPDLSDVSYYSESTLTDSRGINERVSLIANAGDLHSTDVRYQQTAGATFGEIFSPLSESPSPYLPSTPQAGNIIERRNF